TTRKESAGGFVSIRRAASSTWSRATIRLRSTSTPTATPRTSGTRRGTCVPDDRGPKAALASAHAASGCVADDSPARRRQASRPRLVTTPSGRLASPRTARTGARSSTHSAIAAHESPRTTKLYDRTNDQVSLDEIE